VKRALSPLLLLFCFVPAANAVTIDFDGLNYHDVITNQYATIATFSTIAGQDNRTEGGNFGSTQPWFLCTFESNGAINCANPTFVDFTTPVDNLTFLQLAAENNTHNADVDVFVNYSYAATVPMVGSGNVYVPTLIDLTAYSNVTRIEIKNITDPGGLGWDDFTFDVVPEPSPALGLGVGLACLAIGRSRRR
jgi:hypothetical protein